MDKGWVKLHRQIHDNHFLMHDNICYLIFTKMLTMANRKGEVSGGRKQLAEAFNIPEYVFYRAMNRLEKQEIVHRTSHSKYTVFSICNWSQYQSDSAQIDAHGAHSTRTAPAHSNKNKKENRIKDYLQADMQDFLQMRKAIKKPLTDKAIDLIQNKLDRLYPDMPDLQVQCLQQSIENSWAGVFPISKQTEVQKQEPIFKGESW